MESVLSEECLVKLIEEKEKARAKELWEMGERERRREESREARREESWAELMKKKDAAREREIWEQRERDFHKLFKEEPRIRGIVRVANPVWGECSNCGYFGRIIDPYIGLY